MDYTFLMPDNMKILGFNCITSRHPYYKYENDGTKHYNKDYNKQFPEGSGKVWISVNLDGTPYGAYMEIKQDGGTRKVYHGVVDTEDFFVLLLNRIR